MTVDIENILQTQQLRQVELDSHVVVEKSTSILQTIEKMREGSGIQTTIVVEGGKPVGILNQHITMLKLALSDVDLNNAVETIMAPHPQTLMLTTTLRETIDLLRMENRRALPIVDEEGKILGVATVRALISHIAAYFPAAVYNLPPHPRQVSSTPDGA
jgi:predicted transcriptional regulator